MSTAVWDTPQYRRIVEVKQYRDALFVEFGDGTLERVEAKRLLPPGATHPDWGTLRVEPEAMSVCTDRGNVAIPWDTIRAITDPAFAAHLANVAAEQARLVGQRLRALREQRGLSSRELAQRAGIAPQSLSRIENGRHDVVFTTLRRILTAMGYSLKDLMVDSREASSSGAAPTGDPVPGAQ